MKMFGVVNGIQDFKSQKRNETLNVSFLFLVLISARIDVKNKIRTTHYTSFQSIKPVSMHKSLINDNI